MRPILFHIPLVGVPIYSYGLMLAAGALVGLQASVRLARRRNLDEQLIIDATMVAVLSGIVGARMFFVLQFYEQIFARPERSFIDIFKVWQGGLVFYGGAIFATAAVYGFTRLKKMTGEQTWDMADCAAVGVILGLGFGRIGCTLNGCCFGRVTDSWIGVVFPKGVAPHFSPVFAHQLGKGLIERSAAAPLPVIPTQPISSLHAFALFAVLYFVISRRAEMKGSVAHWAIMLYPVGRFLIEFLRDDNVHIWGGAVGPFTVSQAVSIVVFALAVPFYVVRLRRWRAASAGDANQKGKKDTG